MNLAFVVTALLVMGGTVHAECSSPLDSFVMLQYKIDKVNTIQTLLDVSLTECANRCLKNNLCVAVNFKTGRASGQCNMKSLAPPDATIKFDPRWTYLVRAKVDCSDATTAPPAVAAVKSAVATATTQKHNGVEVDAATADVGAEVDRAGTTTTDEPGAADDVLGSGAGERGLDAAACGPDGCTTGKGKADGKLDHQPKSKKSKTKTKSHESVGKGYHADVFSGGGGRTVGIAAGMSMLMVGIGLFAARHAKKYTRRATSAAVFEYDDGPGSQGTAPQLVIETDKSPLLRSPTRRIRGGLMSEMPTVARLFDPIPPAVATAQVPYEV